MEGVASATVCITGAAGFIGSWLVMRLLEQGYFVRATVRDPGKFCDQVEVVIIVFEWIIVMCLIYIYIIYGINT